MKQLLLFLIFLFNNDNVSLINIRESVWMFHTKMNEHKMKNAWRMSTIADVHDESWYYSNIGVNTETI